jgi:hypothetical protein
MVAKERGQAVGGGNLCTRVDYRLLIEKAATRGAT